MKKISKILIAIMLVGATALSLAACSKKSGGNATLEAILDTHDSHQLTNFTSVSENIYIYFR